jgi:N4-gp56 family major capsid protein
VALNTTASGGLTAEMKTYYDRKLLVRTVPNLLYAQFGQKRGIPKRGGKIVEFRRFSGLAVATTPLTEGALYTNIKDITVTAITATVAQYGDAVGFSDLVSTTTIDDVLDETVDILSEQASETIDEVIREVLVLTTSVIYASTATARNQVTAAMVLDPATVRRAVLQLKLNRAKKIDGFYHAIIHPRQAHDLMSSTEWREAQNYGQTGRIFDGSLGTLYGVKFWETDKSKVYADAGSPGTVDVYAAIFFGKDAYGVIDLAGHNLKTIFQPLGSAGTADPLEQQQTFGWKVGFVAKILNDAFMVRVETATSTGAN